MVEPSSKSGSIVSGLAKLFSFQKYTAALIGKTGVGKTTIYNLLCNTSHATTYSKGSLTFEIRKNDVSHGHRSFELVDTPGVDSSEMPIQHALLIKEALTHCPLNAIFVLIPFDPRPGDKMLDYFDETVQCLKSCP